MQKQQTNLHANKEQKPKICPRLLRHNKTIDTTTDNSANMRGGGGIKAAAMADNHGVELVPLLARRRAFERPISLSTTDVTKRTASNDRYASKLNMNMNMHSNNNNNNNNIHNSNNKYNKNFNSNNNSNNNINNTNGTTCCLKKFTLHIR